MTTHDPDDEFFYSEDTGLDALDFDTPIQPDDDGSGLDALPDYSIGEIDHRTNLDGVDDFTNAEVEEDEDDGFGPVDADAATADEDQGPVVQAINPPGTVAVTAYLGGSVAHVDLDPKVTALTESQLAEEIRFVAGVATKKAAAVVHVAW
ncbi:ESX-1 secretion-associated protein EspH [Mycolicibacterium conceptionense]|uniref:ESX-1 secretion-associated protein EspH n=1 Tax=Mycolicibacterium conceptionense TaxID=451644 RepID=A0A0U1DBG9_9MYCO|nr:ESX-1 secretion-associated protein EspH [Mycolicibacterium conceptionense]